MFLKLLRKYDIKSYYFVSYNHPTKGYISTLALAVDPLNYIDLYEKEEMSCFGNEYRIPLSQCPQNPYKTTMISPRKALKWANLFIEEYKQRVNENKNSDNPNPYRVNSN